MPRFTALPPISGFSVPDGPKFEANADGVFDLPLEAGVMDAFRAHGIRLTMLDEDAKAIAAVEEAALEQQRELDRVAAAEAQAAHARAEAERVTREAEEKIVAEGERAKAAEERAAAAEAALAAAQEKLAQRGRGKPAPAEG
jgi:hypothetical protein